MHRKTNKTPTGRFPGNDKKLYKMEAKAYIKNHKQNEFYVKKQKGYYLVIDGYDKSVESIELTEESANRLAEELNELRAKRLNK